MAGGSRAAAVAIARMRELSGELPDQFARGFARGVELAQTLRTGPEQTVYVVGMGGSGAAGEFVRALIERESRIHYYCIHAPEIPERVGPDSCVILLSYSGETWEVLRAREQASRRSARTIAITSGGELGRLEEEEGEAFLALPSGLPPRSAIGFTFGGLLGLLDSVFPETLEDRVARARAALESYRRSIDSRRGTARRIASRIGDRMAFVYGETALAAVARRWVTSIEENAKQLAEWGSIPEVMHNSIVGWDAVAPTMSRGLASIILEWGGTAPVLRQASDFLARTLVRRGCRNESVTLPSDDLLEASLQGIVLGDFVSLAVAERQGTDPLHIEAISRYREWMARAGDRRETHLTKDCHGYYVTQRGAGPFAELPNPRPHQEGP